MQALDVSIHCLVMVDALENPGTHHLDLHHEFPAQNGEHEKNVRTRTDSLDEKEHGCRILP